MVYRIFVIFLVVREQLPTDGISHGTPIQNISGCINLQLTLSFHIFEVLHCNNFLSKHKITGKYFHTKISNIRLHKHCLISEVTFLLSFIGIAVILLYSCQQMAVSTLPYQNTILKMCIKCNFLPGRSNMGYLLIYFILIHYQF